LIEAQPWYRFLDRHHYIHHVDLGANLNFLLPLADWIFGTLRTELTTEEIASHGTLEKAKATPIGQGDRAREEISNATQAT
jgi:sterol desaturase/sphingolipid hydroxylase (fatty acid hydroxylase superfamily)